MGLDSVELIMAFEEDFGIQFDDLEAEKCVTPGHVVNCIYPRVRTDRNSQCPSQKGFYKIRKIIISTFNVRRNDIYPGLELSKILEGDIIKNWRLLQKAIGADYFPSLERSKNFIVGYVIIIPILTFAALLVIDVPLLLSLITSISFSIFIDFVTLRMATNIPNKFSTVGSLIPFVGCSNDTIWSKEKILKRVIELTSEQLGIPVEKIQEKSHFIDDLGVD